MMRIGQERLRGVAAMAGMANDFPNDDDIVRLVGAVLVDQDEHWQLASRRMFSAESMAAIADLEDLPCCQGRCQPATLWRPGTCRSVSRSRG